MLVQDEHGRHGHATDRTGRTLAQHPVERKVYDFGFEIALMSLLTKAALVAAMLIIQSQSVQGVANEGLAVRIAGEAGSCPTAAKIAVVNVSRNRDAAGIKGGWSHDRVKVKPEDDQIASLADELPDLTDGALWLFGPGDSEHPGVKKIQAGARMTLHIDCPSGDFVEAWAPKKK